MILNKPCISPQIPALEILRSSFQSHGPLSTANVKNGGSFKFVSVWRALTRVSFAASGIVFKWQRINYHHVFRPGYSDSPLTWNISRGYSRSWTKQLLLMIPQHKHDDPFPVSAHLMIHISEMDADQTSLPKRGLVDSPGSVRQAAMSFHFFKSAKALLCLLALCKTFDDRGIDHLISVNKWCCVTKIRKRHRISRGHEIRYEWFWVGATLAKSGFRMNT